MKTIMISLSSALLITGCAFTDSAMQLHKTAQDTVREQSKNEKEIRIAALKVCSELPQEMVSIKDGVTTVYKTTTFDQCMASVTTGMYRYEPNQPKDILESSGTFLSTAGGSLLGGLGIWANWDTSRRSQKYSYKGTELQTAYQTKMMEGVFTSVNKQPLVVKPEIITKEPLVITKEPLILKPEIIEK